MREVTAIEPKWLTEVAPSFFKVADQNTISKRKKMEKVQPLFDKCVDAFFVASPTKSNRSLVLQVRRASGRMASFEAQAGHALEPNFWLMPKSVREGHIWSGGTLSRIAAKQHGALPVSRLLVFSPLLSTCSWFSLPYSNSAVVQSNYTAQCSPPASPPAVLHKLHSELSKVALFPAPAN